MSFTSSTFKPKLKDQEYMELLFENGQIIAKGQRSNVPLQDQRTISIFDLYEAEYNEDFKKSIHGCGGSSSKNLVGTQVFPDHHVVADTDETNLLESNKHTVDDSTLIETLQASSSKRMMVDYENREKIEFIPPDEQSVVAERSVEPSGFESSSTGLSEDSERSTYLSTVREMFNRFLLLWFIFLASCLKKVFVTRQSLDDARHRVPVKDLGWQMMTMSNRFVMPSMMLPLGPYYSQMGLATGVPMGVPQFQPTPVLGTGFPADLLSFYPRSKL